MSEFKDEAVSTSGVYFEHAKDQDLFLYHNQYLSQMDFLKHVCGDHLVDEKEIVSLEPKRPTPLEDTQNKG